MSTITIQDILGHSIKEVEGSVDLTVNSAGDILNAVVPKYVSESFTPSVTDVEPPFVTFDLNLILEASRHDISAWDYAHFEFVLSYNSDYVADGLQDKDVLYRFSSLDIDGWMVEDDSVYKMRGVGVSSAEFPDLVKVKYIALSLDIDVSRTIYLYDRARRISYYGGQIIVRNTYTPWQGRVLWLKESYPMNTGNNQYSSQALTLRSGPTAWTVGEDVNYEVYIGKYGSQSAYSGGDYVLHQDSSVLPSGFFYFDGDSVNNFPNDGIPGIMYGKDIFFVTNAIDTGEAFFVVYRASWSSGNSGWMADVINAEDVGHDVTKNFHPSAVFQIDADAYPSFYQIHVIVGTNPDLATYFQDGLVGQFDRLLTGSTELIEYRYSQRAADRSSFRFYSTQYATAYKVAPVKHYGFPGNETLNITFRCQNNYTGVKVPHIFWIVEYQESSSSSHSTSSQSFSSQSRSSQSLSGSESSVSFSSMSQSSASLSSSSWSSRSDNSSSSSSINYSSSSNSFSSSSPSPSTSFSCSQSLSSCSSSSSCSCSSSST